MVFAPRVCRYSLDGEHTFIPTKGNQKFCCDHRDPKSIARANYKYVPVELTPEQIARQSVLAAIDKEHERLATIKLGQIIPEGRIRVDNTVPPGLNRNKVKPLQSWRPRH